MTPKRAAKFQFVVSALYYILEFIIAARGTEKIETASVTLREFCDPAPSVVQWRYPLVQ